MFWSPSCIGIWSTKKKDEPSSDTEEIPYLLVGLSTTKERKERDYGKDM